MKQFLVVLGLVLLVFAGFYLTRDTNRDDTGSPGQQPTRRPPSNPNTQRPELGPNQKLVEIGDGTQAIRTIDPKIQSQMDALAAVDWRDSVDEAYLVSMEDAWKFDFSEVDFNAPVLCIVDGVEITQQDLRREVVMSLGNVLVKSELAHISGQRLANELGMEFGLTDEQWDLYIDVWAEHNGVDRATAALSWSQFTNTTPEGGMRSRRQLVESILAYFPTTAETSAELPSVVLAALGSADHQENVMALLGLIREAREDLSVPDNMLKLATVVDTLVLFWQPVGEDEAFRRTWTCFDDSKLPANAVAAINLGKLDPNQILAPWELPGEVRYVETDELWPLLRPRLTRPHLEDHLRGAIWSKVLRARLQEEGGLLADDAAWRGYAQIYLRGQFAVLDQAFVATQLHKYPSEAHYRACLTLQQGFRNIQPEGWDTDERMAAFFDSNRLFIQNWTPNFDVALFPPLDLSRPDAASAGPDWEYSRQQAQAFFDRVQAGEDFDELLEAHTEELMQGYREAFGMEVAAQFRSQFGDGHMKKPLSQTYALLEEDQFMRYRNAASAVQNTIVRLGRGEVGPPWKTGRGYVVVRMNNARLSSFEDEYEDLIEQTRQYFHEFHFVKWVNEVLADASFELPQ